MTAHSLVLRKILCFFLSLVPLLLQAAPAVVLEPGKKQYPLGKHLDILEDKEGKWTLVDVTSGEASKLFQANQKTTPSFGITQSVYWVRFSLENPNGISQRYILEYDSPDMTHIEIYRPDKQGKLQKEITGLEFPFSKREIPHRNFVFALHPNTLEKQDIYLRVYSRLNLEIPLTLWQNDSFAQKSIRQYAIYGMILGGVLVIGLYNFFLYLSFRDKSYLLYVIFTCFALINISAGIGFSNQYFWPNIPELVMKGRGAFLIAMYIAMTEFSRQFLMASKYAPKLNKFLLVMEALLLPMLFSVLFFGAGSNSKTLPPLLLLLLPSLLFTGILSWKNGYTPAKFYIISWFFLLIGQFVGMLGFLGILAKEHSSLSGVAGFCIEMVLISFALADRVNLLKKQTQEAQEKVITANAQTLQVQKKANEELESKVEERTRELAEAKQAIEDINVFSSLINSLSDLDAIFTEISQYIYKRYQIKALWLLLPDKQKENLHIQKIYSHSQSALIW